MPELFSSFVQLSHLRQKNQCFRRNLAPTLASTINVSTHVRFCLREQTLVYLPHTVSFAKPIRKISPPTSTSCVSYCFVIMSIFIQCFRSNFTCESQFSCFSWSDSRYSDVMLSSSPRARCLSLCKHTACSTRKYMKPSGTKFGNAFHNFRNNKTSKKNAHINHRAEPRVEEIKL